MTNAEKYKTVKKRVIAFSKFCNKYSDCSGCPICDNELKGYLFSCGFVWMGLEAKESEAKK